MKALARWFELRAPVGGDTYTVNVSRVSLKPDATTGELYLDEHGPSLRALYDLGDPAQSRFMHSTGQSGHRRSRRCTAASSSAGPGGVRAGVGAAARRSTTLVLQPGSDAPSGRGAQTCAEQRLALRACTSTTARPARRA